MHMLIYVGPAPSRDQVIEFCVPLIEKVASSVTLLACGSDENQDLLSDAVEHLHIPPHIPLTQWVLPGNAQTAILKAARKGSFDMVILGRLNQPIGRLLPGSHSKVIAQRLKPSAIRVHGPARPIKRILIASGGDHHTFDDVNVTTDVALPLAASVTLMHVVSQQSLLFEGFAPEPFSADEFIASDTPEATVLRKAADILRERGVETQIKSRVGPVIDEIIAELRVGDYDMLVIGAHRAETALDRLLFEDLTDELLDLAALPVLIARRNEDEV